MSLARRREARSGWLFVAPAAMHLAVFAAFPILYALFLSLFDWNLLEEARPFVGLATYRSVLSDSDFWNAMWNSTRYALMAVPAGAIVALLVASCVAQRLRGMAFFRTLFYIPSISSGVAISMLWIYVYLPQSGMINSLLQMAGLPHETAFLDEVRWAMLALVFMSIWIGLGPRMIVFVAGIMGIPPSLYEAAEIDGASRTQQFFHVTLPMLAPTTFFVLVTSTISAFQLFTPIYMMTQGAPMNSTDVVGYHIYVEAWKKFEVGTAAAQSFVLLVAIAIFSLLQFRLMRSQLEGYSAA